MKDGHGAGSRNFDARLSPFGAGRATTPGTARSFFGLIDGRDAYRSRMFDF